MLTAGERQWGVPLVMRVDHAHEQVARGLNFLPLDAKVLWNDRSCMRKQGLALLLSLPGLLSSPWARS